MNIMLIYRIALRSIVFALLLFHTVPFSYASSGVYFAMPNLFNSSVTQDKVRPMQAYLESKLEKEIHLNILNSLEQLKRFCQRSHAGIIIWSEADFLVQQCPDYELLMISDFSLHLYRYKKNLADSPEFEEKIAFLSNIKRLGLINNTRAAREALAKYKNEVSVNIVWYHDYYQAFKALISGKVDVLASSNILLGALSEIWKPKIESIFEFEVKSRTGLYIHKNISTIDRQKLLASLDESKVSDKELKSINLGVNAYQPVSASSL